MALDPAAPVWFDRPRADDSTDPVRVVRADVGGPGCLMQRELVERAQRGDADAFRELVYEAGTRLYAIAYRILRDPDRAQDALQQALIQMWDGLPGLRDPDRFDAWSYRLVVHASYREARHERRWTAQVREIRIDPPTDDRVADVVDRDEVERSFRQLSPEHRAVLVLHFVIGLPIREVADVLGVPMGTAASRLHYATQSFRAAFEAGARCAGAWRTTA
jgi:RNA polymerase sigma-70 factor (ECF subfamily)